MKFFNTAGPVNPEKHYAITSNLDKAEIFNLIEQEKYFVLHAPRQTGKTSAMRGIVTELNASGKYYALYVNIEVGQAARNDINKAFALIMTILDRAINEYFGENSLPWKLLSEISHDDKFKGAELFMFLSKWASLSDKPLVVFLDEVDALIGDTLIGLLRQLRTGYNQRPKNFPQSICLIGVRDVKDYRIWSPEQGELVLGGSSFNINAESLRLDDFTQEQVRELYLQHTTETGQVFQDTAIERAFELTQGQPWLVNALAFEACFRRHKDRSVAITADIINEAKDELIRRRDTHLDVLIDRLTEKRVQHVLEPMFLGEGLDERIPQDDIQYCIDLGLIAKRDQVIAVANPIYREVLPRELVWARQEMMSTRTFWYQNPDGSLDIPKLLRSFQEFYRENSEAFVANFDYKESGPHLLLMAYLQRIVNGGGAIHREYALGRKRLDLLVTFKKNNGEIQKTVIELKTLRTKYKPEKVLSDGLAQTADYAKLSGTTDAHLVLFDKNPGDKSWDERIKEHIENHEGLEIKVWEM